MAPVRGPDSAMEHDGARWEPARLAAQGGDDVAALVYRAYLLGGDARVSTWHGVVSAKAVAADPLTGAPTPIMRISGAGSALAELGRDNLVEFMLDRLQQLRARYVGRATAAYLIQAALRHCAFNRHHGQGPTTTLHHAAAPAAHVDELCGGAVMAIASCGDGAAIVEAIFAGRLGWLDRCHPGPELADRLGRAIAGHPQWHGVIVGGHGLIGWGDTAEACYRRSIVAIAACEQFFGARRRRPGAYARPVPAGQVEPNRTLTSLLPILRGLASRQTRVVIHGDDRPETLAAIDAGDLAHLFGPTMRLLVLDRKLIDDDPAIVKRVLAERLDAHGAAMAGDAPLAFLWPGAGLFGFGADKREARRVVESYMDAINALYDARAISTGGVAWIEPSVANSSPTDEVLARRVAVITGAAGGIGRAIADRFAAAGAAV
ncbi:MAG: hypothetical protein FJX52_07330, partial [Alphaproteobacteria bacterium]|nr:hypothetical protein [Alphaproteobacteria bacterium]